MVCTMRSASQEIRFSKAAPWRCPAYKDLYIKDRSIGRDVYGHERYEYALFRRRPFVTVKRFRTRKQAYQYVSDITGYTQWDVRMGCCNIVLNDHEYLGVIYGHNMYRITKRNNEVAVRSLEDDQLTGWYELYRDCLSAAKEIIQNMED